MTTDAAFQSIIHIDSLTVCTTPIKLIRALSPPSLSRSRSLTRALLDAINYQLILMQRLHLFEQLFYVMGALPSLCVVIALPSEARRQLNPVNKLTIKQRSTFTRTCRRSERRAVSATVCYAGTYNEALSLPLGARCFTRPRSGI